MQNNRSRLVLAFLFSALFLMAFLGTTIVGSFSFGRVAGISPLRTTAQIAGGLAAISFFISASIVAIGAALQPASWPRKLLYILPAYGLGFTLTGVILALLGIGTVGGFIVIWLASGLIFSLLTLLIAVGRMPLNPQLLRTAMNTLGVTSVLSLIAWVAMVTSIVLFLVSPVSTAARDPNNRQGVQGAPTVAAATPAAVQGRAESPRRPGGRAASKTPLAIGAAVLTLFVALAGWSTVRGRRTLFAEPQVAISQGGGPNHGRETGRALLGCLAITVVAWGLGQLIPVSRTNPPVQTSIQWDSPQTENLAQHACMDCHSNESKWPWYAYVAPGSWLTVSHVNSAREALNLSELNNLQSFRRANLSNQVAEEIRSGAMPPKDYLLIHPDARLTDAEKAQLMAGMQQSLANSLAK